MRVKGLAAVKQTAQSLESMQSLGSLKEVFKHLRGVQPPNAWDPSVLADSALSQLLKGRFIFLDDLQAGHDDMKTFFPKAKLVIDCNAYPARAVRREENGVYTCLQ